MTEPGTKVWRQSARLSAVALLIVIVAIVPLSFAWRALWDSSSSFPVYAVRISHGVLTIKHFGSATGGMVLQPPLKKGWRVFSWRDDPTTFSWATWPEWKTSTIPWSEQMVRVPLWIPAFLVGLSLALTRSWRRKRGPGICVKCGYNLAGLGGPERVTCPECGHAATGLGKG